MARQFDYTIDVGAVILKVTAPNIMIALKKAISILAKSPSFKNKKDALNSIWKITQNN
jgi:hypothetical protein